MRLLSSWTIACVFGVFGCGASYAAQEDEALRWTIRSADHDAEVIAQSEDRRGEAMSMEQAAELAVALSPEQAVARSTLQVSHAEVDAVGASFRPEVRVFALPGVDDEATRYDVALRVRPDHPGDVRARRGAARLRAVAERYEVDAQREVVATRARLAFNDVVHLRRVVESLDAEMHVAQELRDLARVQREAGSITSEESLAREDYLADLLLERADAASTLRRAEQTLRQLVGLAANAPLRLASEPLTTREPGQTSPVLAAAEARRLAAEREVVAANWRRTPWISFLQVEARVDGQDPGRVGFSVGLEIPLADAGGRQVRAREAEVERFEALRAAAERTGVQDMMTSRGEVERARERHALLADVVIPSARARVSALEEAQSAGAVERAPVLRAQLRSLALERRLISMEGELARTQLVHRLNRYLYQGTERSSLERTP